MNKKYLYAGVIVFVSFIIKIFVYSSNGFAETLGRLLPALFIAFLISKYLNKEATQEIKFRTFTVAYSIFMVITFAANSRTETPLQSSAIVISGLITSFIIGLICFFSFKKESKKLKE